MFLYDLTGFMLMSSNAVCVRDVEDVVLDKTLHEYCLICFMFI
jgi:hypothetical protein